MKVCRPFGLSLALLLLLGSVIESAGHEHVGGYESAVRECTADHDREHGELTTVAIPQLFAAGESHEHQCLGCRLGGHRISLASPMATWSPGLAIQASATLDSPFRALLPWTGRTNRGPPSF